MKILVLMGLLAVFSLTFYVDTYASDVRLIIDGQEVSGLPAPPILRDGRVLVPARAVFERVGGEVGWHSGNNQVTIRYGSDVLVMTIGETLAILNGTHVRMCTPPIIVGSSTMIPIRFPAEAFGFDVFWDDIRRTAVLSSPLPIPQIPDPPTTTVPVPQIPPPPPTTVPTPQIPDSPHTTGLARNVSSSPIRSEIHRQTDITHILTPNQTGTRAYVLVASSPISEVSYFVLSDNRLVVTISNAANMVSGEVPVHYSVPITGVRVAQYTTIPMVTRIVFDVVGAAQFSLSLSTNREQLTIAFAENNISSVIANTANGSDSLVIHGDLLPSIRISSEGYPHFLTINIENSRMSTVGTSIHGGVFATHFITGQNANGASYIQVYVGNIWPSFSIKHGHNSVELILHQNLTGIRYDSLRRELHIAKNTGFTMNINQVHHINDYLNLRYSLILPNAAAMLGRGKLSIMDGWINSVAIDADALGNARLIFDTNRVLNFTIHETPDSYIIRANLPRDLSPFIVVIDPGHGGTNPGSEHNGIREPELVLIISNKVMQLLDHNPHITAYMTRMDNITTVPNHQRADFANQLGADLFVSIHANAAEISPGVINPAVNGIETLYSFPIAEQNANNNFTSRQFAEIVQRHMVQRTGARDRELVYSPGIIVLRYTNMPSVLVETGFLTNPQEAALLITSQYQWQLAHAIYDAIVEAFNRFSLR